MSRSRVMRRSVLAAVLGTFFWASLAAADNPKPWFKEEHFDCSPAGMELTSFGGSQHQKAPRSALGDNKTFSVVIAEWEDKPRDATRSARVNIQYYPDPGDAQTMFRRRLETYKLRESLEKARRSEGVRMISGVSEADRLDNISYTTQMNGHVGVRVVHRDRYMITIDAMGDSFGSDEQFLSVFDTLQRCAYDAIGEAGGKVEVPRITLTLQHVHPFARKIPADRQPGDVIATARDAEGNAVRGGEVVFYFDRDDPLASIFEMSHAHQGTRFDGPVEHDPNWMPELDWSRAAVVRPGASGQAGINYIAMDHIRYWDLAQATADGPVRGELHAVLLDTPHGPAFHDKTRARVIARASVPLEFHGIARIIQVASLEPDSRVLVRIQSERPGHTGTRAARPEDLPVDLQIGDSVLLDQDDFFVVRWLSGAKMDVRLKPDWELEEGQFGKFGIGHADAGYYRQFDQWFNGRWAVFELNAPAAVVGYFHSPTGAVHATATITFTIFYSLGREWADPLIVTPHSRLLFDLAGERITLYTLEGRADLKRLAGGGTVSVPAGQRTVVSGNGEIAAPSAFDRGELTGTLRDAADNLDRLADEQRARAGGSTGRPGSRDDDDGGAAWIIVLVVVLAVVAGGGAGVFFLKRRRSAG